MTAKPIVPSKDALRALRNLIHPTAPGSVCALAVRNKQPQVSRFHRRSTHVSKSLCHTSNKDRMRQSSLGCCTLRTHSYATAAVAQVDQADTEELDHSRPLDPTLHASEEQSCKSKSIVQDESRVKPLPPAARRKTETQKRLGHGGFTNFLKQPPTDLHQVPSMCSNYGTLGQRSSPARHISAAPDAGHPQSEPHLPDGAGEEQYANELALQSPFFALGDPVPSVLRHRYYKPVRGELPDAEFDRYSYIYNHFLHVLSSVGMDSATRQLMKTMGMYAATGQPEDWCLVKLLHRTWSQHFQRDAEHRLWWPLIKDLLQQDPPNLPAVSLFYNAKHESTHTRHRLAQLYLVHFCRENLCLDAQIKETFKILDGTKLCRIDFSARLIGPVVASAVRGEGPDTALKVLEMMLRRCNMEPNRYLLAEIARGYALNRNWSKFESFVADKRLVEMDLARSKPLTFAALVKIGLREFAEHHSAEQTYDFLTHYMQNHALMPDYRLSSVALQVFVEARRFDLVQRWTRERRKRFPLLDVTTAKVSPAYDIATGWYLIRASCSDILNTCLALAHGEVHDPFSPELRFVAEEPIIFDLHKRYSRLWNAIGQTTDLDYTPPTDNWRDMCTYASDLAKCVQRLPESGQVKFLAQDLKKQVAAVRELESLFAGQYTAAVYEVTLTERSKSRAACSNSPQQWDALPSDLPVSLQYAYLPRRFQELVEDINEVFEGLKARGLKPNHGILMYVAGRLTDEDRPRDAYLLLRHFHDSIWMIEQPWDIELYTRWLEVASLWRHPPAVRNVLWAVVDAPDAVRLTGRFLLLVRIAQMRTHPGPETEENKCSMNEMEYLSTRLRKRRWQQSGCPSDRDYEQSRFPAWSLVPSFFPSSITEDVWKMT
ncbi:hypothetical protein H2198_002407 [Neophaeococcomyces mojaviensis]|uniref:Uncharacterized protein n=1 Tax=Neophaeococcomyces mojaviensis TaxID=3383035 RepID=A0ACC3AEG4_9EURO|nr:hypothetical protein H2198_002407 [Knufia sp. JES_112]